MFNPEVLARWFLVFIFYSIAGWVMEVIVSFLQHHKFINRGFLVGPLCPIYGTGAVLLSILMRDATNTVAIFCVWFVGGSIIEYTASYVMEKLFRVRWWDYTKNGFDLNGRVCLMSATTFGVGGVLILKFINPVLFGLIGSLPQELVLGMAVMLAILLAADIALSLWLILGVRVTVGAVKRDATEEISERVRDILSDKGKLNRRLIKAFPNQKPSDQPIHRRKSSDKE